MGKKTDAANPEEQPSTKKPKRRRGSSSAAAISSAERERQAIALRREGYSFDDIATMVGYSDRSGAKKAVDRGLSRWMRQADEELRGEMLEKLAVLEANLWPTVNNPNPTKTTMEIYLRIVDMRAKLSGAYAARRQQVQVDVHTHGMQLKLNALRALEEDPEVQFVLNELEAGEDAA